MKAVATPVHLWYVIQEKYLGPIRTKHKNKKLKFLGQIIIHEIEKQLTEIKIKNLVFLKHRQFFCALVW